jgi:hypothetical protein
MADRLQMNFPYLHTYTRIIESALEKHVLEGLLYFLIEGHTSGEELFVRKYCCAPLWFMIDSFVLQSIY